MYFGHVLWMRKTSAMDIAFSQAGAIVFERKSKSISIVNFVFAAIKIQFLFFSARNCLVNKEPLRVL